MQSFMTFVTKCCSSSGFFLVVYWTHYGLKYFFWGCLQSRYCARYQNNGALYALFCFIFPENLDELVLETNLGVIW